MIVTEILQKSWTLWLELAPYLLPGLIVAGLMKTLLPVHLVSRWLGGSGIWPSLKAAIIGTPLPLCSCSVLPAAIQLHRSGASRAATVSFLIATPENGADSISMSWGLLGPAMTLLRLAGATVNSVLAGCLTAWLDDGANSSGTAAHGSLEIPQSCCSSPSPLPSAGLLLPVLDNASSPPQASNHPSCCSPLVAADARNELSGPEVPPSPIRPGFLQSVWHGLGYAFNQLLGDIAGWLIVGVITAAAIQQLVPPDLMGSWGGRIWAIPAVLLVSIPTYVCATASTPIAASLLAAGLSPGAVIVFLLAGPATNFSSAAIVRRELGTRAMAAYLTGVVGITLAIGLAVDLALPGLGTTVRAHLHHHSSLLPHGLSAVVAVALGFQIVRLLVLRSRSRTRDVV